MPANKGVQAKNATSAGQKAITFVRAAGTEVGKDLLNGALSTGAGYGVTELTGNQELGMAAGVLSSFAFGKGLDDIDESLNISDLSRPKGLPKVDDGIKKRPYTISMRDEGEVFKSVTEVSYKNLKKVTVFGDYRYDLLYDAMQHTLDIVKNEEVGTEALSVYFLSDMKLADECISDAADGAVKQIPLDKSYTSIHNNPSGETFSILDFDIFVTDSNCKIMMIVGNDGNVYILKKLQNIMPQHHLNIV